LQELSLEVLLVDTVALKRMTREFLLYHEDQEQAHEAFGQVDKLHLLLVA